MSSARKRIHLPVLALDRHDIDVREQHERLLAARLRRRQARRDGHAAVARIVQLGRDALAAQRLAKKDRARLLATRGIGGVDLDVVGEQRRGFRSDVVPVHAAGEFGHDRTIVVVFTLAQRRGP